MHSTIVKNHRTILFVDARNPSSKYQERANRLIESLNGAQIKVDVHAVKVTGGLGVVPIDQVGSGYDEYKPDDGFNVDELIELAKSYGYDQILFSLPG